MRQPPLARALVAELIGTFALVFAGAGGMIIPVGALSSFASDQALWQILTMRIVVPAVLAVLLFLLGLRQHLDAAGHGRNAARRA